jgi:uncharacterized protein YbaA (DUF1428 family)
VVWETHEVINRETQIELMKTARERHDALIKKLMADPKIRDMLTKRDNDEQAKVHPAVGA